MNIVSHTSGQSALWFPFLAIESRDKTFHSATNILELPARQRGQPSCRVNLESRHVLIMPSRKRSHDEFEEDESVTEHFAKDEIDAKRVQNGDGDKDDDFSPDESIHDHSASVKRHKRSSKSSTEDRKVYPSISHLHSARLQSVVKLGEVQNLVLYILADGPGPQWCSVQHRSNIRKVVVLMVPGLEMDMLDGTRPLPVSSSNATDATSSETATSKIAAESSIGHANEQLSEQGDDEGWQVVGPKRKSYASPDDFYPKRLKGDSLAPPLQPLADIFKHVWPIKTPGDDRFARMFSPLSSLLSVPIQKTKDKHGKGPSAPAEAKRWRDKRTPITEYLASTEDLMLSGYVLHPAHFADDTAGGQSYKRAREADKTSTDDGWIDTPNITNLTDGEVPEPEIEQGAITAGRSILIIDCEMCITSPADVLPQVFSLTRMTAIDWNGKVVLDELVQPTDPITNYLTPFSGITPEMLENVTTTLQDAQQMLLAKITPHTILAGHSLDSDLKALRITHPFIVDTALLYPHPRGPPLKSSLKFLAQKYLSRVIQAGHGSTGHDSAQDAQASLDLVKQKCDKGKLWGTSDASNESIFHRLSRSQRPKRFKIHPDGKDEPRTSGVVDWGEPRRGYGSQAKIAIGCKDDNEVVEGVRSAVKGGTNDIPVDGVDFVWARLRELEAYREWWTSSKTSDVDALRLATTTANTDVQLGDVVAKTISDIDKIWQSLPPCTAFIVYSGSGDPRKLSELQDLKQKHKAEYAVKKWDELSIRWTNTEEQVLRRACETARKGIGFITVK